MKRDVTVFVIWMIGVITGAINAGISAALSAPWKFAAMVGIAGVSVFLAGIFAARRIPE